MKFGSDAYKTGFHNAIELTKLVFKECETYGTGGKAGEEVLKEIRTILNEHLTSEAYGFTEEELE
jgi:hypothetical protein